MCVCMCVCVLQHPYWEEDALDKIFPPPPPTHTHTHKERVGEGLLQDTGINLDNKLHW